jgi:hypothetical protein
MPEEEKEHKKKQKEKQCLKRLHRKSGLPRPTNPPPLGKQTIKFLSFFAFCLERAFKMKEFKRLIQIPKNKIKRVPIITYKDLRIARVGIFGEPAACSEEVEALAAAWEEHKKAPFDLTKALDDCMDAHVR